MTAENGDIVTQLTPAQIVALTLYGEARGSSQAMRDGIASVIANRVNAQRKGWGLTPAAVCLARMQFSCWTPLGGVPNYNHVMGVARLLAAGRSTLGIMGLRACLALGASVIAGAHVDTVHGATHYYAPAAMVPKGRMPAWAKGLEPVAEIEGTKFYAGVA
jgi:hypothetical protein